MGETNESNKSTRHSKVTAASLVYTASEEGKARELADAMMGVHQHHEEEKPPLKSLRPDLRKIVEDHLDATDPAARKLYKKSGGYHNYKAENAGKQTQTLAEDVNRMVGSSVHSNLPEVKAIRIWKEIVASIIKRNGWDKDEE